MGAICTTPELQAQANVNKQIEKKLNKQRNEEIGNQKLLLLGTGECGKSTVLKQMQILHKNGFSDAEINEKREIIYSNIIIGMGNILQALSSFAYNLESTEREVYCGFSFHFTRPLYEMDARRILSMIESGKDSQPFTPDIYESLKGLWADKAVQKAFSRSFMDQLDRIYTPNYRPTTQDILHTRVPTTGIVQVQFTIKGCIFRNESQQLYKESYAKNRLMESLDLFAQICNSKWFIKASMILFLNKTDLFIEKIGSLSIKVLFKNYDGRKFHTVLKIFLAGCPSGRRKIYIHETCATDTNQVQLVIDSVIDTVIGKNLKGTGME
uniref:G-protein alpha subunit n=1 Tax=Ascaris lumbricoides TaxID=6252 RepID=A0A0M3I4G5_ASCLU